MRDKGGWRHVGHVATGSPMPYSRSMTSRRCNGTA
jgi:hypothetical protein